MPQAPQGEFVFRTFGKCFVLGRPESSHVTGVWFPGFSLGIVILFKNMAISLVHSGEFRHLIIKGDSYCPRQSPTISPAGNKVETKYPCIAVRLLSFAHLGFDVITPEERGWSACAIPLPVGFKRGV